MTPAEIRSLAEKIADELFTRTTFLGSGGHYLGGWSKSAAVERIIGVLTKEAKS